MRADGKIDYVEFPAADLPATKRFYAEAFGWTFADQNANYAGFENKGLDGGFSADPWEAPSAPMVTLYTHQLEEMKANVLAAGGVITRDTHRTPGGLRFQFRDPSGNELAVWSEEWIPVYPPREPRNLLNAWREWNKKRRMKRERAMA
jgi:predicted enzyme related to lactoylglutathione lyase